tara:strand:- start:607 stop:1866 length:1260 start_codon:yes stop_codon:yes gene_type:complete
MEWKEFLTSKGVSDISKIEDVNEQASLHAEYLKSVIAERDELISSKATQADIDKASNEIRVIIDKGMASLNETVKAQGIFMQKQERNNELPTVTLNKLLSDNKEALKDIKKGGKNVVMALKAVGDMSLATNTTGQVPQAERLTAIGDVKERQIKLLDVMSVGSIGSNLREWLYVANEEGVPVGPTAEGALKNQIDFEIIVGSQKVEKITAFITITDEMLDDVEQIQTLINNKLSVKIRKALEQGCYNGSGVSPNLNGIATVAPAFNAGALANTVDNPNIVDVLQVASLQIELAEQDMATGIMMNPADVTNLLLAKISSTDKRYIERLQMIAGQLSFDGIPVIKSTLISAGEFLMGDFSKASLDYRQGVTIEVGYNADNFVKNYKSIRAELRAVCYVEHNDRSAFVQGDFATAIADLLMP